MTSGSWDPSRVHRFRVIPVNDAGLPIGPEFLAPGAFGAIEFEGDGVIRAEINLEGRLETPRHPWWHTLRLAEERAEAGGQITGGPAVGANDPEFTDHVSHFTIGPRCDATVHDGSGTAVVRCDRPAGHRPFAAGDDRDTHFGSLPDGKIIQWSDPITPGEKYSRF